MAIEFHCQQCNTLLKTPDDSAGQQAKCPKCGALTTIPAARSGLTTPAAAYPPPASVGSAAGGIPQFGVPQDGEPLRTTILDVGNVLNSAWAIFKANMGLCIGAVLANAILAGIVNQLIAVVVRMVADGGRDHSTLVILMAIAWLPMLAFTAWLNVGLIRLLLRVARGEPADMGVLFSGGDKILPAVGATVLMGFVVALGYLLCIIPGIIFGLMFSQTLNLVVDKNADPVDAMKLSKQITTGNKVNLFLLGLAAFAINLAGMLLLCVGLIFTIPYSAVIFIVAYLVMSGQRVNVPTA